MLAIRAARLFDGEKAAPYGGVTVFVEDGRIGAMRAGEAAIPPGAELVDLGDATLLPGLVDAHLHLAFDASPDPVGRLEASNDEETLAMMRAAGRTALAAGVTTVRDLGDRGYLALRLRDETAADPAAGPRILAAGPPITVTRGHCWYLGGEADGVDGVRAAVREHAARGVDVIKIMASGGELTPGTHSHVSQYGVDELRAAVREAHGLGLPVTAHAHAVPAVVAALESGVDSIEHCTFMTEDGIDDRPDVVEAIAASGTTVCATIGIRPGGTPPPRILARFEALARHMRRMREAGVTLIGSSDAGIGPAKPHDVLPHGVGMLVNRHGWSTVDALRAVTAGAARVCRLDDRLGRLAPGLEADVLAVGGDPLADPAALLDVRAVFRRGHRVR